MRTRKEEIGDKVKEVILGQGSEECLEEVTLKAFSGRASILT